MTATTIAADAPAELYEVDGDAVSYRISGQRAYDMAAREFGPGPDLTAGQAKQSACREHGDLAFTDYRVRKQHLRYDETYLDEETGWRGAWRVCEAGEPGAVAYWRVKPRER